MMAKMKGLLVRKVQNSRYTIKQLAASTLVVAVSAIIVYRVASYGVLALFILAAMVYSFYLLAKSHKTSDMLVCFFVYLLNLVIAVLFVMAWMES